MDKSNKLYAKAFKNYRDGNIEKAILLCERSISENIQNSSAVNLKGLLVYFKGDIDGAQCLWKMNLEVNKDSVSEKYLIDSMKDRERLKLYKAAVELFNKLNVNEALELLMQCRESDFNTINVNNYIAACFIKKGEYQAALKHINNVLEIERKNKMAFKNKNILNEYEILKHKRNLKPALIILFFLLVGGTVILIFNNFRSKKPIAMDNNNIIQKKNANVDKETSKAPEENAKNKTEQNKDEVSIQPDQKKEEEKKEQFPIEEIKKLTSEKDYDNLYEILKKVENKAITQDEKDVVANARNIMETEGVEFFYNAGKEQIDNLNYENGKEKFLKAYSYGEKNTLYELVVYMLAATSWNMGNTEEAIKYYNEYDEKFPRGGSEETVLYELALIYGNKDINTAKSYAQRLRQLYPYSKYINMEISKLLD